MRRALRIGGFVLLVLLLLPVLAVAGVFGLLNVGPPETPLGWAAHRVVRLADANRD